MFRCSISTYDSSEKEEIRRHLSLSSVVMGFCPRFRFYIESHNGLPGTTNTKLRLDTFSKE